MITPWRTVQVFLSAQGAGVFEVEIDTDTKETRCTCPVYNKRGSCKHIVFVNLKMRMNEGHYSISIPGDVPEEMAIEANEDPKKFREFVLKYATVEVL